MRTTLSQPDRRIKMSTIWSRLKLRLQREMADRLARRPLSLGNSQPLVSFTFDDFPRSALHCGGAILRSQGLTGTFYASFGLMGGTAPTGQIFVEDDLIELIEEQHELGCHTFDHCHSWITAPSVFKASIIRNRAALAAHFPQMRFRTFSYPISFPRPRTKWQTGECFNCCRGGGQNFNAGTVDRAHLKARIDDERGHRDEDHQRCRQVSPCARPGTSLSMVPCSFSAMRST